MKKKLKNIEPSEEFKEKEIIQKINQASEEIAKSE